MGRQLIDLTGQLFGHARALHYIRAEKKWACVCTRCGRSFATFGGNLRSGRTQSCGCTLVTHGQSSRGIGKASPTYVSWLRMRQRCRNPRHVYFRNYGGRGITVCDRWRDSFENFLADMGERPEGTSLDRIDNARGYEPGNCRWASRPEQQRNTSRNHLLTFRGETHSIAEWGEITGISRRTIRTRLRIGWSVEDALTLPPSRAPRSRRTA